MTLLTPSAFGALPNDIKRPNHHDDIGVGIVHFGPGAFHRAHQAAYIDTVLRDDPRWGIAAVSMRSRGTVAALAAQGGLYTLVVRDAEPSMRVIAAHRRFLAPDAAAETHALLADTRVELVTTTVTEKGYCLGVDGTLDLSHPDIVHDLAGTHRPASVVGWLVSGLAARRATRLAPFMPMPCDNLASNGAKLHAALIAFARARDTGLADWIAGEVTVPSTMVDSITPASDDMLSVDVAAALGFEDRIPVQREAFTQWVIEDVGRPLGPDLAAVGATVTNDVAGYEKAKLRILNGAHSTLAYAGLLRGHASVADAMADADLAAFIKAMIRSDIAPMLPAVAGFDLDDYARAVLARFANPMIVHRLDQIAQDGSQKLPYRLGDTLDANRRAGRLPVYVVAALGCWVAFLMRRSRAGIPIVDPAGARLFTAAAEGDAATVVDRLVQMNLGLPKSIAADADLLRALKTATGVAFDGRWADMLSRGQTR